MLSNIPHMGLPFPWVVSVISHPRGGPHGKHASTVGYPGSRLKPTSELVGSSAFQDLGLADGGPCAVRVDQSHGLGPRWAEPSRVCAEPCSPLWSLARSYAARRTSTVRSAAAAGVGRVGHQRPVASASHLTVVGCRRYGAHVDHVSGAGYPAGVDRAAPSQQECGRCHRQRCLGQGGDTATPPVSGCPVRRSWVC
jgi:hypothetical protein